MALRSSGTDAQFLRNMQSDFQKTVQCRFESCLKKVVRSVVKDYYKELNRRKNKEISFSELPDVIVDKMTVWDDYETDYTIFSVCGIDIRVLDDELAEALKKLPERKRNTLLMYYEYYGAAEPPVRCGESHLSGLTEPPQFVY